MDSIDGSFMNFAYGWALSRPVRKVFNFLGFVIVMFMATRVIALLIWRLGRIGERWSVHLHDSDAVD